jgi:hypothetical protein
MKKPEMSAAREKLVARYKEVHKEKTGIELTDQEALAQALNLVTLVKAVVFPDSMERAKK